MEAKLNATVERVIYTNEDKSWSLLEVEDQAGALTRASGALAEAAEGMRLVASGRWDSHRGVRVFRVDEHRLYQPNSTAGILRFLSSDAISGIGVETAKSVVDHFGASALDVIRGQPERLAEVPGLGERRAITLSKAVAENAGKIEAKLFLYERFGTARAEQLYRLYGSEAPRLIGENPYRLIRDVEGIGFQTADALGTSLGFRRNSFERISAAVLHAIQQQIRSGATAILVTRLMDTIIKILAVQAPDVGQTITRLSDEGALVSYETRHQRFYTLPAVARAECAIAERLHELLKHESCIANASIESGLESMNTKAGRALTKEQGDAVSAAFTHKVCVITGGPGTGKTAVLDTIRKLLHSKGVVVHLCAPTGLAARLMRDATGGDASTIHRLLEYDPIEGLFTRNERRPLSGGVVIVDESSMCDVWLISALLRAMTPESHLVLIGDSEQLPSVSAGCVLRDVMQSQVAPTVRLTHTFRQEAGSRIISLARTISAGQMPRLESGEGVIFHDATHPDAILNIVVDEVASFIRNSSLDIRADIQVVTPRNRGPLSVREANIRLQRVFNPAPRLSFQRNGYTFGVGDKVMQVVNDAGRELSNGDIGWIQSITEDGKSARVVMSHCTVEYDITQMGQLVLAYAVTAHKAQGSEFPVVILAVDRSSYKLFDRTLLYTAVTRAKQQLIVVGDGRSIKSAIKRDHSLNRTTTLRARLESAQRETDRGGVASSS
ncbi:ATP-dependent RecD-like DNA helicase [Endozoicomonas sp. G2_2]|uniref:SF1B family DNA helicase RecD2 n=1 Tax=Endozoicomonas sp. G2_2 TaxID=2821092 RepID=UPI001ADAE1BD|nr:ATP-dependent RecD-like DNA helicase [Endozoicomonas sp. G2_2]MBO9471814.1 ATP-dependent RecD-like DNA helicase [Endozoicomonas sp. G2_2]